MNYNKSVRQCISLTTIYSVTVSQKKQNPSSAQNIKPSPGQGPNILSPPRKSFSAYAPVHKISLILHSVDVSRCLPDCMPSLTIARTVSSELLGF